MHIETCDLGDQATNKPLIVYVNSIEKVAMIEVIRWSWYKIYLGKGDVTEVTKCHISNSFPVPGHYYPQA